MSVKTSAGRIVCFSLLFSTLTGCFHPPYNNFNEDKRTLRQTAFGTGVGAGAGWVIGTVAGTASTGLAIGALTGAAIAVSKNSKRAIIKELSQQDIQFIEYGNTSTVVVPTDHYFVFDTPHLNDICYPGLISILRLLKYYPDSTIYVAGFTDNVGSRHHKKMLSQARAEAMLTFLWANDIQAQRLQAEGYADKNTIGDNKLIHGSAYNRRLEIQIVNAPNVPPSRLASYFGVMK